MHIAQNRNNIDNMKYDTEMRISGYKYNMIIVRSSIEYYVIEL